MAGVGAGGIVALRAKLVPKWKAGARGPRGDGYVFIVARVAPEVALFWHPILFFMSIGEADHLSERRREREAGLTLG